MIPLSVVLPVRNGLPYIRQAIESVINQQMADYELIVVDNRSTDATIDVIRSFGDPRIRIIRESRLGGPTAFNAGLRIAKGHYIARMDADDESLPERFGLQTSFLDSHDDIHIVGSQAYKIDEYGRLIGTSIVPQDPIAIQRASRHAVPFVHPTLMFRREVWERLVGYREFSPAADYDMLLRALSIGFRMANLPHFLLRYRILSDSVSHRYRQQTIIHSFAVKKMNRLRNSGHVTKEQEILSKLQCSRARQDRWFSLLDRYVRRLTRWRNRHSLANGTGVYVAFANALIAAISGLHHDMFRSLWSAVWLKLVIARYAKHDTPPTIDPS